MIMRLWIRFLMFLLMFLFNGSVMAWAQNFSLSVPDVFHASAPKVLEIGMLDLKSVMEEGKGENLALSSRNDVLRSTVASLQAQMDVLEGKKNKLFLEINQAKALQAGFEAKRDSVSQGRVALQHAIDLRKDELGEIKNKIEVIRQDTNHFREVNKF